MHLSLYISKQNYHNCDDWIYCAGLRGEAGKGLFEQVEGKKEKATLYSSTRVVFIQVEVIVKL